MAGKHGRNCAEVRGCAAEDVPVRAKRLDCREQQEQPKLLARDRHHAADHAERCPTTNAVRGRW